MGKVYFRGEDIDDSSKVQIYWRSETCQYIYLKS